MRTSSLFFAVMILFSIFLVVVCVNGNFGHERFLFSFRKIKRWIKPKKVKVLELGLHQWIQNPKGILFLFFFILSNKKQPSYFQ